MPTAEGETSTIPRPSRLRERADPKDPCEPAGQRYRGGDGKCQLEIPSAIHDESGERR